MTWLGWAVGIILSAMVVSAIWGIWGLVKRDLKQRYPDEWSRFVIWNVNRRLDKAERRLENWNGDDR